MYSYDEVKLTHTAWGKVFQSINDAKATGCEHIIVFESIGPGHSWLQYSITRFI